MNFNKDFSQVMKASRGNVSMRNMAYYENYDICVGCIYNSGGVEYWTYELCNLNVCLSSCLTCLAINN